MESNSYRSFSLVKAIEKCKATLSFLTATERTIKKTFKELIQQINYQRMLRTITLKVTTEKNLVEIINNLTMYRQLFNILDAPILFGPSVCLLFMSEMN